MDPFALLLGVARKFLPTVLRLCVSKRAPSIFVVEQTDYGWSVGIGSTRMGLFVTQRQALDEVKRRRAELTAKGQTSTVLIRGSDPALSASRSPPSSWHRR
jgi:hypothetical protein